MLKILMLQNKLYQRDLAARVGCTQQTISKWCVGLSVPNLKYMQKLADALNVDLHTIVDCFATKKDQG